MDVKADGSRMGKVPETEVPVARLGCFQPSEGLHRHCMSRVAVTTSQTIWQATSRSLGFEGGKVPCLPPTIKTGGEPG